MTLTESGNQTVFSGNPFHVVKELWRKYGSATGFFSYEMGELLEALPFSVSDDMGVPDLYFAFPAASPFHAPARFSRRESSEDVSPWPVSRFMTSLSRSQYVRAVNRVKSYISRGDVYQVNIAQRFAAPFGGDPRQLFHQLMDVSPAPWAAYIDGGNFQILSSSPELFLQISADGHVLTRPIKGTRPRGRDFREDCQMAEELLKSEKDRAELLMIVDLERNDLGRVCRPGSIRVKELRVLESFPQVHHTVATVEGRLQKGKDAMDCLMACFPGGSITGAPKIRAMEIIRECEPVRRGVYTGAIGYLAPDGSASFNIAIRTMVISGRHLYFHVGAGIVADSDPAAEYEETLAKAGGMLAAMARNEAVFPRGREAVVSG